MISTLSRLTAKGMLLIQTHFERTTVLPEIAFATGPALTATCPFLPLFRESPMQWNWPLGLTITLLLTQLAIAQGLPAIAEREAPANAESGLLSRWQFTRNHTLGNTVFPVAGSLHPAVLGPVEFSRQAPFALMLDGNSKAGHRVVASHSLTPAVLPETEVTVEAWAKVEEPLEWGGLAGIFPDNGIHERGWILGFRGTQFSFGLAGQKPGRLTYLASRRRFTPGYWYQVVGTYDGKEQRIYVDGELLGQSTEQQGAINYPSRGEYVIGAYKDDDELHATEGEIEQVSVWNRVLTPEEIATRFANRNANFPDIIAVRPQVSDWPTYNRDNQRTGISLDEFQMPLSLAWEHQLRHPPKPAWPAPAKQDFWHYKYNLSPRVVYDRANHVVSVGDRVYFGSSADDAVRCLDAVTGKQLWTYFTEAPCGWLPRSKARRCCSALTMDSSIALTPRMENCFGKFAWDRKTVGFPAIGG
jgi:hypothetical protein